MLDCGSRVQLRMTNWVAMMAALQDFEITIPDNYDVEAIALLDNKLEVRDYAERFVDTIRETKLNVVSTRLNRPCHGWDARRHLQLGLLCAGPEQGVNNGDTTAVLAVEGSKTLPITSGDVTQYTYPSFVFSPTILGGLTIYWRNPPFTRDTLALTSRITTSPVRCQKQPISISSLVPASPT